MEAMDTNKLILVEGRLDKLLEESSDSGHLPQGGKVDYWGRYERIAEYLTNKVHKHTVSACMAAQLREVEDGKRAAADIDYLTDHGVDHVRLVIERATDLLRCARCAITPYEAYLLLSAIQIHDAGLVYGRDKHEEHCEEVMMQLRGLAGDETTEQRAIIDIACAHSGRNGGGRVDTIGTLEPMPRLLGQRYRAQFLAAVLRFADELADDRSRASRFLADGGGKAVFGGSEVYHAYSLSLRSVLVKRDEVFLDYEFSDADAAKFFKKGQTETFLLDEVFSRCVDMHLERMYCDRFLRPHVSVRGVRCRIDVYADGQLKERRKRITYSLEERGYPQSPAEGIHGLCPELNGVDGGALKKELDSAGGSEP